MSVWDGRYEYYLILDELTAPEGYGVGDHMRAPSKTQAINAARALRAKAPPMAWYLDQLGDA